LNEFAKKNLHLAGSVFKIEKDLDEDSQQDAVKEASKPPLI